MNEADELIIRYKLLRDEIFERRQEQDKIFNEYINLIKGNLEQSKGQN